LIYTLFYYFQKPVINYYYHLQSNKTKKIIKTKNRKSTKHKQLEKASDKKEKEKARD